MRRQIFHETLGRRKKRFGEGRKERGEGFGWLGWGGQASSPKIEKGEGERGMEESRDGGKCEGDLSI